MSRFDGNVAAYFASQHGLITVAQIIAGGGSTELATRRCKDGSWIREHKGLYRLAGAPNTDLQQTLTAVLAAPTGTVAWGSTAAALHEFPGFSLQPITIAVGDHQQLKQKRARLRYTSALPEHHTTIVHAIPTTSIARTLFDIAASHHPKRAERALDNAIGLNIATLTECQQILEDLARSGRNGVTIFRRLLEDRADGDAMSESELELQFESLLTSHGIEVPKRQVHVAADGKWIGRLDYQLGNGQSIEVDSRRHHTALLDYERDISINNELLATGQAPPLRITHRMMRDHPEQVVRIIRRSAQLRHSNTAPLFPRA